MNVIHIWLFSKKISQEFYFESHMTHVKPHSNTSMEQKYASNCMIMNCKRRPHLLFFFKFLMKFNASRIWHIWNPTWINLCTRSRGAIKWSKKNNFCVGKWGALRMSTTFQFIFIRQLITILHLSHFIWSVYSTVYLVRLKYLGYKFTPSVCQ